MVITRTNGTTSTYSGAGRSREPSRKIRDGEAEAEEQVEPPRKKGRIKKDRTSNTNAENCAPSTQPAEFAISTLKTNRTSSRASNIIKLRANTDGIPAARGHTTPARVVGGQRQTAPTPVPPKQSLSVAKAAQLHQLRAPFSSPSRTSPPRTEALNTAQSTVATPLKTSRPVKVSTIHGHSSASRGTSDEDLAQEKIVSSEAYKYVETLHPIAYANHRRSSASTSGAGLSPIAEPLHSTGTTPQRPRPTHPASASGATAALTTSNELRQTRTPSPSDDIIGRLPQIDQAFHVAILGDVADEFSDPGEPYDDYASKPRARAQHMAYHSLRGMPNQHARETSYDTYDAAEQEEEDQDPEANLEDAGAQAYTFDGDDNNNEESSTVHPEPELSSHSAITSSAAIQEEEADFPEAQYRSLAPGKKAGARDFEPRAQEILERAITIYKTHIMVDKAFPDKMQERTWAKSAWSQAAREVDIKMQPDSGGRAIELIMRYSWNLRGEIKAFARHFVPAEFGFKHVLSTDSDGVQRNLTLARKLLDKNGYTYKEFTTRTGLFEGDIVQVIINKVFYKNAADDGVVHDDRYRPFPMRGVALILTAIKCAVQEWATGIHQNVNFDEDVYKSEYDVHFQDLARDHAKAPLVRDPARGLPAEDFDRAIAAYRLRLQTS